MRLVRWLLLSAVLLLFGCTQPGQQIARLEITPGAVLLTASGQTQTLSVRVLDTNGQPMQAQPSWSSSRPEAVSVGQDGQIKALVEVGSSQIVAQVGSLRSAPVLVLVAPTVPGAVLLDDAQILSEPANLIPDTPIVQGSQFRVLLGGLAPPAPGTVLIGRGGKGLAGKVVSSAPQSGGLEVTLELVPLTQLFTRFKVAENFDVVGTQPVADPAGGVTLSQQPDGSWLARGEADATSPAPARMGVRPSAAETTFNLGPFKCKGTLLGRMATAFKLEIQQRLNFQVDIDTEGLSLNYLRLLGQGSLVAVGTAGLSLVQGFEGDVKCKWEFGSIPVPVGGVLSFLLQPVVPYGVGFKLKGTAMLPLLAVKLEGRVGGDLKLGFEYSQAGGFRDLSDFKLIREFKFKGEYPLQKGPRVELGGDVFGYATLSVAALNTGWSLLDKYISKRADILEGTLGARKEFNLAIPADQAADESYASDYSLKLRGAIALEGDLKKFFEPFDRFVQIVNPTLFTSDIFISRSPHTPSFQALPAEVTAGQTVRLTMDLQDLEYLFVFYNVREVEIYKLRQEGLLPALVLFRTLTATEGQRVFTADWVTTAQDVGEHTFVAFVHTDFFSVIRLELDKNTKRKVLVKPAISGSYVTLNTALKLGNEVIFPAGSQIALNRIEGGMTVAAHLPYCDSPHLHSSIGGIYIDSKGPFPDPETGGCGYGKITAGAQKASAPPHQH